MGRQVYHLRAADNLTRCGLSVEVVTYALSESDDKRANCPDCLEKPTP